MRSRGRVLVVDEDPIARLTIDQQLETLGWDVLTLNNGAEAIRVIECGLGVQVLLVNVRLPDLDGRLVADVIARLAPRLRVAFMADALAEPVESRRVPLLVKPFSTSALDAALSRAVCVARPA
jgi:CheY-like chemotaxis protein